MADPDILSTAADLAKQLASKGAGKDIHIKSLKRAAELAEGAPQGRVSVCEGFRPLADVIVKRHLIEHKDKDVRILVAYLACQLLRVFAPDPPYDDIKLEAVFDVFCWALSRLSNSSQTFQKYGLLILSNIHLTKCQLPMLDLNKSDLPGKMLRSLMGCTTTSMGIDTVTSVVEICYEILSNAEEVTQDMTEAILEPLVATDDPRSKHAQRVAKSVLERAQDWIRPSLEGMLHNIVTLGHLPNSSLPPKWDRLLCEVYSTCPAAAEPLLPYIVDDLSNGKEDRRVAAVRRLCALLQPAAVKLDSRKQPLLQPLLLRLTDQSEAVRLAVLENIPGVVVNVVAPELALEVVAALQDRLQDRVDAVRAAAVAALSSVGCLNSAFLTPAALEQMLVRLRDTKLSVRRAAAAKLLAFFRRFAVSDAPDGEPTPDRSALARLHLSIPLRVAQACLMDRELKHWMMDSLLEQPLFPSALPPERAATLLAAMWLHWPTECQFLCKVLRWKALHAAMLTRLLHVRQQLTQPDKYDAEEAAKARESCTDSIAEMCPHPAKAKKLLTKLMEKKDNAIFRSLLSATSAPSPAAAAAALKDVRARLTSRSPLALLVSNLCSRAAHGLVTVEQARILLSRATAAQPPSTDAPREDSLLSLEQHAAARPRAEEGVPAHLAAHGFAPPSGLRAGCIAVVDALSRCYPRIFHDLAREALRPLTSRALPRPNGPPSYGDAADSPSSGSGREVHVPPAEVAAACVAAGLLAHAGKAMKTELLPDSARAAAAGSLVRICEHGPLACVRPAADALARMHSRLGMRWERLQQLCDGLAASVAAGSCPGGAAVSSGGSPPGSAELPGRPSLTVFCRALALCTIGAQHPQLFAQHALVVTQCVAHDLLATDVRGAEAALRLGSLDQEAPTVSQPTGSARLKGECLVWLAAALASPHMPKAQLQSVAEPAANLVAVLETLVEPGCPEDGTASVAVVQALSQLDDEESRSHLRLMAASAMLRLASRLDSSVGARGYVAAALVMQDPMVDVRSQFVERVHEQVLAFQQRGGSNQLAAKWAALFALTGMDPNECNRRAAQKYLEEFVVLRREAVQKQLEKAANNTEGASLLCEMPELMLPYLIHLLSSHPDLPDPNATADSASSQQAGEAHGAQDPAQYDAFQKMLAFGMQPLLAGSAFSLAGTSVPAMVKTLRTLKTMNAVSGSNTSQDMHIISDIALAVLRAMADLLKVGGKSGAALAKYPGAIPLPKSLFSPSGAQEKPPDGSHLPDGFQVIELTAPCPIAARPLSLLPGPSAKLPAAATVPSSGQPPLHQQQISSQPRPSSDVAATSQGRQLHGAADVSHGGAPSPQGPGDCSSPAAAACSGGDGDSASSGKRQRRRFEGDSPKQSSPSTGGSGPAAAPPVQQHSPEAAGSKRRRVSCHAAPQQPSNRDAAEAQAEASSGAAGPALQGPAPPGGDSSGQKGHSSKTSSGSPTPNPRAPGICARAQEPPGFPSLLASESGEVGVSSSGARSEPCSSSWDTARGRRAAAASSPAAARCQRKAGAEKLKAGLVEELATALGEEGHRTPVAEVRDDVAKAGSACADSPEDGPAPMNSREAQKRSEREPLAPLDRELPAGGKLPQRRGGGVRADAADGNQLKRKKTNPARSKKTASRDVAAVGGAENEEPGGGGRVTRSASRRPASGLARPAK